MNGDENAGRICPQSSRSPLGTVLELYKCAVLTIAVLLLVAVLLQLRGTLLELRSVSTRMREVKSILTADQVRELGQAIPVRIVGVETGN